MANTPSPYPILKKVSLDGFASAFFASYPAGFVFDGEAHDFYEAVLVQKGRAGVTADDAVFELSAGELILYRPWVFHRLWTIGDTPADLLTFSFSAERMPHFQNLIFRPDEKETALFVRRMKTARDIFLFRGIQVVGIREGCSLGAQKLLQATEQFLLSLLSGDPVFGLEDRSVPAHHYVELISCMRRNIGRSLNVEQLARMTSLSPDNIKKIMEKYAGEGVMQHFTRLKIQEGMRLLEEGALVCEAAERVGYSDPDLFGAAFKRVAGMSPSEWKKARGSKITELLRKNAEIRCKQEKMLVK